MDREEGSENMQRLPGFEPSDAVGLTVDEAQARFQAAGYTWVIVERADHQNAPRSLELAPDRIRLSVRDGRVVSVERG